MLNDNWKFDYHSHFRLSFSNSAGAGADIIALIVTAAGLYNCVTSRTKLLTPFVECAKQAVSQKHTALYVARRGGKQCCNDQHIGVHGAHLGGWCQSLYWPGLCYSRHWLAADNLLMLGWISECSWVCTYCHLLSHWLIKPHIPGLVTAGLTFMDRRRFVT